MILILGGTTEGRELANSLQELGYPCILTVTTGLGAKLAGSGLRVLVGELDNNRLAALINREDVDLLIDATHPYALEIKEVAAKVAKELRVPYLRLERPAAKLPGDPGVIVVPDYRGAAVILEQGCGGILFTIGVRNLALFQHLWMEKKRPVWVKIYPEVKSLETCFNLGLHPEQIFAFHGPGDKGLLKALFAATGAAWIVTKDGGAAGGVALKAEAALEMRRKLLVIQRPAAQAEPKLGSVGEVIEFVRNSGYRIKE